MARLIADLIMVNGVLLAVLILRYIWLVGVQDAAVPGSVLLHEYIQAYLYSAALLTPISLLVFAASGFYTRGRTYRGRFKALSVAQGVTLAYLLFGFAAYLLDGAIHLPRSVPAIAWALTVAVLVCARMWAHLWTSLVRAELWMSDGSHADPPLETVLVIGGDGYIGSALVPKLLEAGYRVRVLSLFLYGIEPIEEYIANPKLELIHADFRQVHKVVEAMRNVDAVVHLGAIVGDPACELDEELTVDVNLMATRMIAEVAKGNGVSRFVFASTCSVYGASDEVLDEHSKLNPVSLYARTKVACERVLMSLADETFSPVSLRFATIYGLSGRTRFDLVVNLLAAKAMFDEEITVVGGDQWRPFLHVDDAALALLKVLQAPLSLTRNQVFNVGSNEQNYTIKDVGELVNRLVPGANLIETGSDSDRRNYRVDFGRIRNELGFVPQWTLRDGINQVVDAIRSGAIADYRDEKYSNVKFLRGEGRLALLQPDNNWANELLDAPFRADRIEANGRPGHGLDLVEEFDSGELEPATQPAPSA